MFHQDYVGHFDPRTGIDYSARPPMLKPSWPVSREAYERTLARFDPPVAHCVVYRPEGWVVCDWTGACLLGHPTHAPLRLSAAVRDFARTLAENDDAVVMTEMFVIWFPAWAKQAQEDEWAQMARERDAGQANSK
jgi:hypothetical protein